MAGKGVFRARSPSCCVYQIASSVEGSRILDPSVVVCGHGQTVAISRRGELFAWGVPLQGCASSPVGCICQRSVPSPVILQNGERIVGICQGTGHTLAITEVSEFTLL